MDASDLDFLTALDAELSTITTRQALEAKKTKATSKINGRTTHETRVAAKIQILEINSELQRLQWKSISTVALFTHQHCDNCGSDHKIFLQFMENQTTTTKPKVERWKRVSTISQSLPRTVLIQKTLTHICADCCGDFNFSLANGQEKFNGQSFNIPMGYNAEEIQ